MSDALSRPDARALAHPAADGALTKLETAMGGRAALVDALAAAPPTEEVQYVLGLIADPRNDARSLADLCRAGGVAIGVLLEAYKRGRYAPMQVAVIDAVATETPVIVRDVLRRAQPHLEECPACHGVGSVTDPATPDAAPTPCRPCGATGTLLVQAEIEHQKLALDLAGLGPRKAPLVAVDSRKVEIHDTSPAGLAKLLGAVDRVLHPKSVARTDADGGVIDVVPAGDPSSTDAPPADDPPAEA